jgi:hypothetical protein
MNAACKHPGKVPKFYGHYAANTQKYLRQEPQNPESQTLAVPETNEQGLKYCEICNSYKP